MHLLILTNGHFRLRRDKNMHHAGGAVFVDLREARLLSQQEARICSSLSIKHVSCKSKLDFPCTALHLQHYYAISKRATSGKAKALHNGLLHIFCIAMTRVPSFNWMFQDDTARARILAKLRALSAKDHLLLVLDNVEDCLAGPDAHSFAELLSQVKAAAGHDVDIGMPCSVLPSPVSKTANCTLTAWRTCSEATGMHHHRITHVADVAS
jgi:hypothetical protein